MNSNEEKIIQRKYYERTSDKYDDLHLHQKDEHYFALSFLVSILDFYEIKSILDVGSGTGRVVSHIIKMRPDIEIIGVEPVKALRELGHKKNIPQHKLVSGDVTALQFSDGEFDLVCEFGVLHHIKKHNKAVSEMLRVAKKAIFISDCNNFGQGKKISRTIKQIANFFGIWGIADKIKTRGKGYTISDGDGLAYSYSVFNNYKLLNNACEKIHFLNTKDGNWNLYRTASHVAVLGIKK